jgi:hypothetical protein
MSISLNRAIKCTCSPIFALRDLGLKIGSIIRTLVASARDRPRRSKYTTWSAKVEVHVRSDIQKRTRENDNVRIIEVQCRNRVKRGVVASGGESYNEYWAGNLTTRQSPLSLVPKILGLRQKKLIPYITTPVAHLRSRFGKRGLWLCSPLILRPLNPTFVCMISVNLE